MALSVEYSGAAKTASNGSASPRSSELDATPPEKTTGNPGCSASAAAVARSIAPMIERSAKCAVAGPSPVLAKYCWT